MTQTEVAHSIRVTTADSCHLGFQLKKTPMAWHTASVPRIRGVPTSTDQLTPHVWSSCLLPALCSLMLCLTLCQVLKWIICQLNHFLQPLGNGCFVVHSEVETTWGKAGARWWLALPQKGVSDIVRVGWSCTAFCSGPKYLFFLFTATFVIKLLRVH